LADVVDRYVRKGSQLYIEGRLRTREWTDKDNIKRYTTEKDVVKLGRSRRVPDVMRERLFYQPVKLEFLEGSDSDFLGTLKSDLEGKLHLDSLPKK
jgi:hypothetical protein